MINAILILLFAHFVGDFILQPRVMAREKSKNWAALIGHCLIIFLTMLFAGYLIEMEMGAAFAFAAGNAITHGFIDRNVWTLYGRRFKRKGRQFHYWNDYWFYATIGFDQFWHASVMLILFAQWMAS